MRLLDSTLLRGIFTTHFWWISARLALLLSGLSALAALGVKVAGAEVPSLLLSLPLLALPFAILLPAEKLNTAHDSLQTAVPAASASPEQGLFDRETETYGAQFLEPGFHQEMCRARRFQSQMSLLRISIDSLVVAQDHGVAASEHMTRVLAQILRHSLRGSDLICHCLPGDFAVLLPDTSMESAEFPARRILMAVQQWNERTLTGYQIRPNLGLGDCWDGLETAMQEAAHDITRSLLPSYQVQQTLPPRSQAQL